MIASSNALFGSFIGDALALGPHWIYDPDQIREKLGRVTSFQPPLASYHVGKAAGDFTHYGDQTLLLLRSIAEKRGFDLVDFAGRWRSFWEGDPPYYRDGATRATLSNLQAGASPSEAGSTSHDIAGAARWGPLLLLKWDDDNALLEAIRAETAFTHRSPEVVESAAFFARAALALRDGATIEDALEKSWHAQRWTALPESWWTAALASAASAATDPDALEQHGLGCNTEGAFPGVCHLLLRHPRDPATALIENVNAGGDSAARGVILGLVYGSAFPVSTWPPEWLHDLNARDEIQTLIDQLP